MSRNSNFVKWDYIEDFFRDKTVAIVGSAPSVLDNTSGLIDSYDIVVRVNNYKIEEEKTGKRTDVFYSFFGGSIRKTPDELKAEGVKLCMAKCPDAQIIESDWHTRNNKVSGVDFRKIYSRRVKWWFTKTYAPELERFMEYFELLDKHIPTTGFQAILEILRTDAKEIYITGFDFFASKIHNVNERWTLKNLDDPIRHMPEKELEYISKLNDPRIKFDKRLGELCRKKK